MNAARCFKGKRDSPADKCRLRDRHNEWGQPDWSGCSKAARHYNRWRRSKVRRRCSSSSTAEPDTSPSCSTAWLHRSYHRSCRSGADRSGGRRTDRRSNRCLAHRWVRRCFLFRCYPRRRFQSVPPNRRLPNRRLPNRQLPNQWCLHSDYRQLPLRCHHFRVISYRSR